MHSGGQVGGPNQNGHAQSARSCAGCGGRINDRFLLHAVDRYWHTACLKCSCCQAPLADFNSCFTKAGMILCRNDYLRLFGNGATCGSCGQSIGASELVMKSTNSVYHVKCFTCVTCHNQLVPGDRYSIVNGSILCEQDYPKVIKEQGHTSHSGRTNQKIQFQTMVWSGFIAVLNGHKVKKYVNSRIFEICVIKFLNIRIFQNLNVLIFDKIDYSSIYEHLIVRLLDVLVYEYLTIRMVKKCLFE